MESNTSSELLYCFCALVRIIYIFYKLFAGFRKWCSWLCWNVTLNVQWFGCKFFLFFIINVFVYLNNLDFESNQFRFKRKKLTPKSLPCFFFIAQVCIQMLILSSKNCVLNKLWRTIDHSSETYCSVCD